MLNSISFHGHTEDIPLLTMLLPPDTDNIKKVFPDERSDENDIKAEFEGLEAFLGGPAPCEMYLGRVETRAKKQVLFWQLTGANMTTSDEDEANMAWMNVAVRMSVGGELRGTWPLVTRATTT